MEGEHYKQVSYDVLDTLDRDCYYFFRRSGGGWKTIKKTNDINYNDSRWDVAIVLQKTEESGELDLPDYFPDVALPSNTGGSCIVSTTRDFHVHQYDTGKRLYKGYTNRFIYEETESSGQVENFYVTENPRVARGIIHRNGGTSLSVFQTQKPVQLFVVNNHNIDIFIGSVRRMMRDRPSDPNLNTILLSLEFQKCNNDIRNEDVLDIIHKYAQEFQSRRPWTLYFDEYKQCLHMHDMGDNNCVCRNRFYGKGVDRFVMRFIMTFGLIHGLWQGCVSFGNCNMIYSAYDYGEVVLPRNHIFTYLARDRQHPLDYTQWRDRLMGMFPRTVAHCRTPEEMYFEQHGTQALLQYHERNCHGSDDALLRYLRGISKPRGTNLAVMTFNVHMFRSVVVDRDPRKMMRWILHISHTLGMDLVVLCEVPKYLIGALIKMLSRYKLVPDTRGQSLPGLINLALVKGHATGRIVSLTDIIKSPKSYISLRMGGMSVVGAHLPIGSHGDNYEYVSGIRQKNIDQILGDANPDIVMGDFNFVRDSAEYKKMEGHFAHDDETRHTTPYNKVDHVFYRKDRLRLLSSFALRFPFSDHLPLVAYFKH